MVEKRVYYPNTYKSDNWFLTDMTNYATPTDYNDFCGVHINSSVANKMFYLLFVGGVHNGVNVTGITSAIRIVLDANKNHWLRNILFTLPKPSMISVAFGYGDTEDGIDMQ